MIELPLTFDLTSLVQEATDIENSGITFDDLENGLLAPLTQNPEPSSSKRSRTPPSLPSQSVQSHRNKKRALNRKKKVYEKGHTATSRTIFEHVQLADPIEATVDLQAFPVAKGGYSTRRFITDQLDLGKEYNVAELTDLGITILGWDGRCACKKNDTLLSSLMRILEIPAQSLTPTAKSLLSLQACPWTQPTAHPP